MSYSDMNLFQARLYRFLVEDADIAALIGEAVFDAPPIAAEIPDLFLQIGTGLIKESSSNSHHGREILFEVNVFAKRAAMIELNQLANLVQERLTKHDETASELPKIHFRQARIDRLDNGEVKRVSLRFRTLIEISKEK